MRWILLFAVASNVFLSGPAFAQEWIEYASRADFFSINFPGEPKVQNTTYKTQYGLTLPARIYSATEGQDRFSVTVADFTPVEKMHAEESKKCVASGAYPDQCADHATGDLRGAIDHAAWSFLQRDAKVTFFSWYSLELVEGKQLQLTNADGSRSFVAINMHGHRLYIAEGTVPKGSPLPALFQQSLGFIDKEGKRIRYASTYSNAYPAPPRSR